MASYDVVRSCALYVLNNTNVLFGSDEKAFSVLSSIRRAIDAVSRCGRRRCQLRGTTFRERPLSEDTASLPALVDAPERASALIEVQPRGSDTTPCRVRGNRQSTAGRIGQL